MFVTKELNAMTAVFEDSMPSSLIKEELQLEYVNLEATLLRAKVLRNFAKEKVTYIVQTQIYENDQNLAYLFAPFVLANLNQPVIYTTLNSSSILNQYYQAETRVKLNVIDLLQSLKVYVDVVDQPKNQEDFLFRNLVKALCRSDISQIFLITSSAMNHQQLQQLQDFLSVKISVIQTVYEESIVKDEMLNTRKLLFKNKDDFHRNICTLFSSLNAKLIAQISQLSEVQAAHLIEDMFYSEHIFEKLSVYAEYMQTHIQNGSSYKTLSMI
ncbi:hypothetical protein HGO21_46190 [Acinetobacter sp. CUI P1]|nr:hypothetical protein [Acinetobacter sp. CUI P1]